MERREGKGNLSSQLILMYPAWGSSQPPGSLWKSINGPSRDINLPKGLTGLSLCSVLPPISPE